MKTTQKTPLLQWTGYAEDVDIKNYQENYNDNARQDNMVTEEISFEQARDMLAEDYDYWQMQWECFHDAVSEYMNKHTYWIDNAKGMGWRSLQGSKIFQADNGQSLLNAISPNTDCMYRIWKHYNGFKIRISHHDAPMGEVHILKPLSEDAYNKAVSNE